MSNYVKIHYSGKDYIGQIKSIDSEWGSGHSLGTNVYETYLQFYRVCIYEKDTFCEIDHIYIRSFSEIKPYVEDFMKGSEN